MSSTKSSYVPEQTILSGNVMLSGELDKGYSPFPILMSSCEYEADSVSWVRYARILVVRRMRLVFVQRWDLFRVASTIFGRVPFFITGNIWRKSQHSSVGMPPNGAVFEQMSWRDLSIASNATLWVMGASSTIIARHSDRVLASVVPFFIEQVGVSCWWMLRGTLNVECTVRPPASRVAAIPLDAVASATTVRPPASRVAAIPLDAVASATKCWDRSFAKMRLIRNVLQVPPGASRNTMPDDFVFTFDRNCWYTISCSLVSWRSCSSTKAICSSIA